jgi:hypothetical protein
LRQKFKQKGLLIFYPKLFISKNNLYFTNISEMASSTNDDGFRTQRRRRRPQRAGTITLTRKFDPRMVLVTRDTGKRPYSKEFGEKRRSQKWDQMKLMMGEIQWLVNHWRRDLHPNIVLVVLGSAPGTHYGALAELFEDISEIHLWDDKENFVDDLNRNPRIKIFPRRMKEEDAATYTGSPTPVFFSSNLNSFDYNKSKGGGSTFTVQDIDDSTWEDHLYQARMMEIIQPASALLRFRLPYPAPNRPLSRRYFAGHIYVQCFGMAASTETRLVPTAEDTPGPDGRKVWKMCSYSVQDYEQKLFYVNTELRDDWEVRNSEGSLIKTQWLNSITGSSGIPDDSELLNEFDTVYMIHIVNRLLFFIGDTDESNLESRLLRIMTVWNWARSSINALMRNKMSFKALRDAMTRMPEKFSGKEELDDEHYAYLANSISRVTVSEPPAVEPREFAPTRVLPGPPGTGFFTVPIPEGEDFEI